MDFNGSEVEVDSFGRTVIREQRADDGTHLLYHLFIHSFIHSLTPLL